MAIHDNELQSFFQKQKKASIDALMPSSLKKHNQKKYISIVDNSLINQQQSVSKPLEKRDQTISNTLIEETEELEYVSKALANREQSVSKALAEPLAEPLAKREQSVSNTLIKETKKLEYVSKALAEPLAEPLAKREQSVSKALANISFESLVGKEKELLLFLFDKCKINASLETPLITTEELRINLKISANHLRNLIFRLINKGFLKIKEIKKGRSGWRKFAFPKDIYQNLIFDNSVSKP